MTPTARPRLARKARLRFDRHAERWMLLYPERGLVLNPTAAGIVRLLTGEHTAAAIVDRATAQLAPAERTDAARRILTFLDALADRRLVDLAP